MNMNRYTSDWLLWHGRWSTVFSGPKHQAMAGSRMLIACDGWHGWTSQARGVVCIVSCTQCACTPSFEGTRTHSGQLDTPVAIPGCRLGSDVFNDPARVARAHVKCRNKALVFAQHFSDRQAMSERRVPFVCKGQCAQSSRENVK